MVYQGIVSSFSKADFTKFTSKSSLTYEHICNILKHVDEEINFLETKNIEKRLYNHDFEEIFSKQPSNLAPEDIRHLSQYGYNGGKGLQTALDGFMSRNSLEYKIAKLYFKDKQIKMWLEDNKSNEADEPYYNKEDKEWYCLFRGPQGNPIALSVTKEQAKIFAEDYTFKNDPKGYSNWEQEAGFSIASEHNVSFDLPLVPIEEPPLETSSLLFAFAKIASGLKTLPRAIDKKLYDMIDHMSEEDPKPKGHAGKNPIESPNLATINSNIKSFQMRMNQ